MRMHCSYLYECTLFCSAWSQVGFALICFASGRAEESLTLLEVALKRMPDTLIGQYLYCYLLHVRNCVAMIITCALT